jgi:hypothetical protein
MKSKRVIATTAGFMIGLSAMAPAAVAADPGNQRGWGVHEAQREFRADIREARQDFRADMREARQEFRQDLRALREEQRAKFQEAKQALRDALKVAREAFHTAMDQANDAFGQSVATSRATLLAVLEDANSTIEQRASAMEVYKAEVWQARTVRHDAVKAAISDYREARKAARVAFRTAIGQ